MNYTFTTTDGLFVALQSLWSGVALALPKIIFALIFILIGLLVGWLIKHAVEELFKVLHIDNLLSHTGLDEAMKRAGYKLNSGLFVGEIIRWFFIIVFLIFSFDILGLQEINTFLNTIATGFIPNLIVAVVIIFAGSILAEALSKFVSGGVKMVGQTKNGEMLGSIARWAVWIFTIIIALDQIGIATFYLQTLFQAVLITIGLAAALAFGLGGKEHASRVLDHVKSGISKDN